MRIGVGLPSFASESHLVTADHFRRYCRNADELGFSTGWVAEHLAPNPGYETSWLDPLTALSVAAGETDSISLGTSILVLPLRNPVLTAKRAASLKHLLGRELVLGLGAGYVESEFDAVDVPMAERSTRYLEGLELIRRLFREDEVTFDGEHFSVEEFRLEPDLGRPPTLLAGGMGTMTEDGRKVARGVKKRLLLADGWIAPPRDLDSLQADWEEMSAFLESNGRDPTTYQKVGHQLVHLVPGDESAHVRQQQKSAYNGLVGSNRTIDHATKNWLFGTVSEIVSTLHEYERQNFDEVFLHPVVSQPSELDRQLRLYDDEIRAEFP
jgi:alkanesulfonate monooxygenase